MGHTQPIALRNRPLFEKGNWNYAGIESRHNWDWSSADGILYTGEGYKTLNCLERIVGSEGMIEVGVEKEGGAIPLRVLRDDGGGWEEPALDIGTEKEEIMHASVARAVLEAIDALRTGRRSPLDCRNALRTTEVVFAAYESCRRRARIDLPLTVDDSAFLSMVAKGTIGTTTQNAL